MPTVRKFWTDGAQKTDNTIHTTNVNPVQKPPKTNRKVMAPDVLKGPHAENTDLRHKGFCSSLRLHHHGEGEKAHLSSAKKREALGLAFFNQVVFSWRSVKADRQFLFDWSASHPAHIPA